MPQKPFTVASYAAGAGLAAVALVYVFAPNYLIDESDSRKKGAIGLVNVGNDCFINSNLQALAGLSELRIFLIRETYRRTVDDHAVYENLLIQPPGTKITSSDSPSPSDSRLGPKDPIPEWKLRGLQKGMVSAGLKTILDKLNERPLSRKTLSPRDFVRVLEESFGLTINRQQQDAQEFLQLIFERLKEEYAAGQRVHRELLKRAIAEIDESEKRDKPEVTQEENVDVDPSDEGGAENSRVNEKPDQFELNREPGQACTGSLQNDPFADEPGFPMDGERESRLICQTCGYSTTPRREPFFMLTLSVPQTSSTTLDNCFNRSFAPEYISDFKCEKCRLLHATDLLKQHISHPATKPDDRERAQSDLAQLEAAIATDPEHPPTSVTLPDISQAPLRTITRSTRISKYPKVLVVHLSRSIYDRVSQKNLAKVSFPENLALGGVLEPKKYRLISVITHRGGHTSGHYEAFRRQVVAAPYSNPNRGKSDSVFNLTPAAATPTAATSAVNTPAVTTPSTPAVTTPSTPIVASKDSTHDSVPPLNPLATEASSCLSQQQQDSAPSTPTIYQSQTQTETESQTESPSHSQSSSPLPWKRSKIKTVSPSGSDSASIRSVAKSVLSRKSSRLSAKLRPKTADEKSADGKPVDAKTIAEAKSAEDERPGLRLKTTKANKRPKISDKWWRISDEKCRQAKTSDVLGMNREVYMLFYELTQ
ncbi:hypothetical protein TD95_002349 [Thielaviopsis punctulata]|uniref:Ubiquitin carboxyl-terminal hydrolase n=1 Tax=Thielaviopsis punctulata TaxID=72032 RepID=A0A0F4ZCZ8_9PEZI|nr:hypothetical protein TD95_002349 [Thielaviopsis punctulata]